MKRFSLGLSLVLAACGGAAQKPVQEPALTAETTSADMPEPTSKVASEPNRAENPTTVEDDSIDPATRKANALALTKAQGFAKNFTWTDKPTFEHIPTDGSVGAVGEGVFVIDEVKLSIDEKKGTWEFQANGGASGVLGVSIDLKGMPKAGGKYNGKMGKNRGLFQAPQNGKRITSSEFSDTISVNGDNAYALEITKLTLDKDGKHGKASGRFVSMYKAEGEYPAMWAAGTFSDALVTVWKK